MLCVLNVKAWVFLCLKINVLRATKKLRDPGLGVPSFRMKYAEGLYKKFAEIYRNFAEAACLLYKMCLERVLILSYSRSMLWRWPLRALLHHVYAQKRRRGHIYNTHKALGVSLRIKFLFRFLCGPFSKIGLRDRY